MFLSSDFLSGLTERLYGPMHLRFLMQPLMACFFALRDGKKDAMDGKPPYFWALFTEPEHRRERLQSGWKSIGKVFIVAFALDVIFQFIAFHGPRLRGGAMLTGIILALVPYVLLRGPVNRLFIRKLAAIEGSHAKSRAA